MHLDYEAKLVNKKKHKIVPINIISGPLGVGKTTMINHLLQQRPSGERWAILVNEYGLVGIDAAFMHSDTDTSQTEGSKEDGVEIREVAGGCICCSAGIFFEATLIRLLRRRPDRLLIEPTGLAALSGILDTLGRPGIKEAVDIRSVICLLNADRLKEDLAREEVIDQVEAADLLIASRADLVSSKQLEVFMKWGTQLFPPKKWVGQVERGRLPLSDLDLISHLNEAPRRGGHSHGTDHHHDQHIHDQHTHEHHNHEHHHDQQTHMPSDELSLSADHPLISRAHHSSNVSTIGWICWHELQFDAKQASEVLIALNRSSETQRVKAVLRTNEGWWQFNFTDDTEEQWPSSYRRDSRIEVIYQGDLTPNLDHLERQLRNCLV